MSVALIVKNTILVILIILIGHFMVKNMLIDKSTQSPIKHSVSVTSPNTDVGGSLAPIKSQLAPSPLVPENETPIAKPASDAVSKVHGGLDKAKEELLKFIDDEEDDVEKFFSKETTLAPTATDNCKVKSQENTYPLSTTCDPSIHNLPRTNKTLKGTTTCLEQDKKSILLLNEYENESTMNGGQLFGGLSAYDAFDSNFQVYSC